MDDLIRLAVFRRASNDQRSLKMWVEPGCDEFQLQPGEWIAIVAEFDSKRHEMDIDVASGNWDIILFTDHVAGFLKNGSEPIPCLSCSDLQEGYLIDRHDNEPCARTFKIENTMDSALTILFPRQQGKLELLPAILTGIRIEGKIGDVPAFFFGANFISIDCAGWALLGEPDL